MIIALIETLKISVFMFWEVFWPLSLGFMLSAVVQAFVPKKTLVRSLGGSSPKNITLAAFFGAASSSCSYAAVALARSIFQKGASFLSAMVFEIASTNLVFELAIILIVLLGWQFAAAEWLGGILMVILIALIFRFTLTKKLIEAAKKQAGKGLLGRMEGHAAMDMSIEGKKSFWQKLFSPKGFTAVSHFYVMNWVSIWIDILLGFLIAGALTAWVPQSFWQVLFFKSNSGLAFIEGPLVGPLVAAVSFVCSVGNVPLAAVLWGGGISFGGVVSFIFADLIILPILDIYQKYYSWKVMVYILVTFYAAMVVSGYVIEIIFNFLHLIPTNRNISVVTAGIHANYTTWLGIFFLFISAAILFRFVKTGGSQMLKMMDMPPRKKLDEHSDHIKSYTCPMHPDVRLDKPGSCPKCGMKLTKIKILV